MGYKLNYKQIEQSNTNLCWQAVTNIFSYYYCNRKYFIEEKDEKNVIACVETGISLAIGRNVLDIDTVNPPSYQAIYNAISEKKLLYACLNYGNGAYHATVIVGAEDDKPVFCIYDPMTGSESRYAYCDDNNYYDETARRNFSIWKIAG